jgi:hypothetical protein
MRRYRGKPGVERPERLGLDPVDAPLGGDPARDQTAAQEHLQMLGHRRLADHQRFRELAAVYS